MLAAICGNMALRADSELFTREQVQPVRITVALCASSRGATSLNLRIHGRTFKTGAQLCAVVKDRRPRQLPVLFSHQYELEPHRPRWRASSVLPS